MGLSTVVVAGKVAEWSKQGIVRGLLFAAYKALISGVVMTLVPLALIKAWMMIKEQIFSYMQEHMSGLDGMWNGSMVELTGLAAWLADLLKFQQCFAILAGALVFRFTWSLIRGK